MFDLASIGGLLNGLKGLGGGGSKAISTSSSAATNSLNLAFNPVVASTVGGQMYPFTGGDSYGNPSTSATAQATASDTNPSSQIPWYYGSGGVGADLGTARQVQPVRESGNSSSSMVLFAMIGLAVFYMTQK